MISVILTSFNHNDTVLLSSLLENTLQAANIPFISSRTQYGYDRGDSTIIHLVIGSESNSPRIERKSADLIISGDPIATKKAIDFLKPEGFIVSEEQGHLSDRAIEMGYTYPEETEIFESLKIFTPNIHTVPAQSMAQTSEHEIHPHMIILGNVLNLDILPVFWNYVRDNFVELGTGTTTMTKKFEQHRALRIS